MAKLAHAAIQLGSGPVAFGLYSAAALPPLAAFPRFFSLIATPTSVHVNFDSFVASAGWSDCWLVGF